MDHPLYTISEILRQARAASGTPTTLQAQLLLGQVLGRERSWVLAHPETVLSGPQLAAYWDQYSRLHAGEPLPYLLGEWEFYGRKFRVDPAVMIPRPETELMVEWALELARPAVNVLDVGTGSGCIAVTLACELPEAELVGTDRSPAALWVARTNAVRHGVDGRIRLIAADLTQPLIGRFDLICANLPYIPSGRLRNLPVAESEPELALDGGADGVQLIRRALSGLPRLLAPNGVALFEIDPGQANAVRQLAQRAFPTSAVQRVRDLAGRQRLIVIQNG